MNRIVIPRETLVQVFRRLRARPTDALVITGGLNCYGGQVELLQQPQTAASRTPGPHRCRWVLRSQLPDPSALAALANGVRAVMVLGIGPALGRARGFIQMEPDSFEELDELRVVGAGLSRIPLHGARMRNDAQDQASSADWWSRSIGALGRETWVKMTESRFVLIGAGRSGSLLATLLARAGVRALALVDPDRVEPHNLGEGAGYGPADINAYKVDALAAHLRLDRPALEVDPLPVSATHLRALAAVAEADVVISAPDRDSARLAAAYLAVLHHKPLLDLGTGILLRDGRREMGADVRLVWPGRCLLCTGGVRDELDARARLASADAERELFTRPRDFRAERAGSLNSLNGLAVCLALRLLEDFIAGRVRRNGCWLSLNCSEDGTMAIRYPELPATSRDCLCRHAGLGEDGLAQVVAELRAGPPNSKPQA